MSAITPLTRVQKATAQAIVNIFETDVVRGDYSNITVIPGDTGHLTYGRSQTTLGSGNLYLLLEEYCNAPGAAFADDIRPYLDTVKVGHTGLDHSEPFKKLLQDAGKEPVMQAVQDVFFDKVYWQPAARLASVFGIVSALGTAVVYDSQVHGSLILMRNRTNDNAGSVSKIGEKAWISAYVKTRRSWLANHSNKVLHNTVYRMDAFRSLLEADNWDLDLPLIIRGKRIDMASLGLPWLLRINEKVLGECQAEGDGSNFFPARLLLENLFGTLRVNQSLHWDGSVLRWDGKEIPVKAAEARDGTTWAKVRDVADWQGLEVGVESAQRRVTLTRKNQG